MPVATERKLTEAEEEVVSKAEWVIEEREKCRNDIVYFASKVAPHITLEGFHLWWLFLLQIHPIFLLLAPRGHGKTLVCAVLYALWYAIKHPDDSIGYISHGLGKAHDFIIECRKILESDAFCEIFGNIKGERWSMSALDFTTRTVIRREANIMAFSVTSSNLTSYHHNLLIIDDPIDYTSTNSEVQREHYDAWRRHTLFGVTSFDFAMLYLGTRYHPLDNWNTLIMEGTTTCITPAINDEDTSRPFEKLSNCIYPEKYYDALWPQKIHRTEDRISPDGKPNPSWETRKRNQGISYFNAQFQQDTQAFEEKLILNQWIERILPTDIPAGIRIVGVDPAGSKVEGQTTKSNFFAITALIFDPEKITYDVIWHHKARVTYQEQKNIFREACIRFRADHAAIETIGTQGWFYDDMFHDEKLHGAREHQHGSIKLHRHPPKGEKQPDKIEAMRRHQGKFQNHRVRFKIFDDPESTDARMMEELVSNVVDFENQKFKDSGDSLVRCLECADVVSGREGGWFV